MDIRSPEPGETVSTHRYTVRTGLHEAERKLHHFLSAYYTSKSLTTTLAEDSPNPEFCGRVKDRRDEFAQKESSRIILGLRHYVQHHNVLPLLIKMSAINEGGPWYVINKNELRLDTFEYNEPQMIRSVEEYSPWFDYYYEGVNNICIYPFETVSENWAELESLREDIYDLARTHLQEEIEEYVEQLSVLEGVREDIRTESEEFDELIEQIDGITPELRELLSPELYDRLIEDED